MLSFIWYNLKNNFTFNSEKRKLAMQEKFYRHLDELEAKKAAEKDERTEQGETTTTSSLFRDPSTNVKTDANEEKVEEQLCSKRLGIVTALETDHGFIDKAFYFDMNAANGFRNQLRVGSKVEYLLYKNPITDFFKVIKICEMPDYTWDNGDESDQVKPEQLEKLIKHVNVEENIEYFATSERKIVGLIKERKRLSFVIDTDYGDIDVNLETVNLEYMPMAGDRVIIVCKVQDDKAFVDVQGEILDVVSIKPNRLLSQEKCTVIGVYDDWVKLRTNHAVAFISRDDLSSTCKLNVNDIVNCDLVECERDIYFWRAIRLDVKEKAAVNLKEFSSIIVAKESNAVDVTPNQICVLTKLGEKKKIEFHLTNNTPRSYVIKNIKMRDNQRDHSVRLIEPDLSNTRFDLVKGQKATIVFEAEAKSFNESRERFCIEFEKFLVTRSITVIVVNDENEAKETMKENNALNGIRNYSEISSQNQQLRTSAYNIFNRSQEVVPGVKTLTKRRFIAHRIPGYDIPQSLRNVYLQSRPKQEIHEEIEELYPALNEKLSFKNYANRFKALLHLEEIEQFINFRKFDQDRAFFTREGEFLVLKIENLAERRPSLVIGDTVYTTNPFVANSPHYEGFIHKVGFDRIYIKFTPGFHSTYRGEDYRLEFFFSRLSFRKQHYSVLRAVDHLGSDFLFPTKICFRENPQLDIGLDEDYNLKFRDSGYLNWCNKSLNSVQRQAVANVLRGEVENMPYIIFGPPGTGKTMTVIEVILQLTKNVPGSRILVATPSNSAADLIATRLIDSHELMPGDFVRLVSMNQVEKDLIPEHLKRYCATSDIGIDGSCESAMVQTESGLKLRCQMKYLGRHRVSIGTCSTLGSFLQMNFPPGHFTHVIIDECGQATESEAMIVITQMAKKRGQVILAGDPNQLQPIITNNYAASKGFSLSFLERILTRPPYYKDNLRFPNSLGYNPRLVTKLVYSYRSLPSILHVYNTLFYNSELYSKVDEENSREAAMVAHLMPKILSESEKIPKSHGVFFHGVRSENYQDNDSPSWYNIQEARNVFHTIVKLYAQKVSPKQIGIITPYSKQVKFIRNMFVTADVEYPKIGSVEEFQGQERDIIVISTVRSTRNLILNDLKFSLGFVQCAKRMNVAISRARSLMIIIGNPHLLYVDPSWRFLIKYCIDNDAYHGCDLPEDFDQDVNLPITDEKVDLPTIVEAPLNA